MKKVLYVNYVWIKFFNLRFKINELNFLIHWCILSMEFRNIRAIIDYVMCYALFFNHFSLSDVCMGIFTQTNVRLMLETHVDSNDCVNNGLNWWAYVLHTAFLDVNASRGNFIVISGMLEKKLIWRSLLGESWKINYENSNVLVITMEIIVWWEIFVVETSYRIWKDFYGVEWKRTLLLMTFYSSHTNYIV